MLQTTASLFRVLRIRPHMGDIWTDAHEASSARVAVTPSSDSGTPPPGAGGGGHVGAVVGSRAARDMYPALIRWLGPRIASTPKPGMASNEVASGISRPRFASLRRQLAPNFSS